MTTMITCVAGTYSIGITRVLVKFVICHDFFMLDMKVRKYHACHALLVTVVICHKQQLYQLATQMCPLRGMTLIDELCLIVYVLILGECISSL